MFSARILSNDVNLHYWEHIFQSFIFSSDYRLNRSENLATGSLKIIDEDRMTKWIPLPADMPNPQGFNEYFANIGRQKYSTITEPMLQYKPLADTTCYNTFMPYPRDSHKIYKIIMNIKNSNSTGYDGLTHRVICYCA